MVSGAAYGVTPKILCTLLERRFLPNNKANFNTIPTQPSP